VPDKRVEWILVAWEAAMTVRTDDVHHSDLLPLYLAAAFVLLFCAWTFVP